MRIRKHTNPLNIRHELSPVNLENIFPNPDNPLYVDIGFAQGEFMFKLAEHNPEINIIGLEARKTLALKAQNLISKNNIPNLHALYASSANHLLLLPDNSIDKVFIFFPDPWFKKKHHKRRVISKKFLQEIPQKLKQNNSMLFQSDVKELYLDTLELLENTDSVEIILNENGVTYQNKIGITSYYEQKCLENDWSIYRIEVSIK